MIKSYMDCSLQARFNYIEKRPQMQNASASFGSCVHDALELYNNTGGDMDAAVERFLFTWANPEEIGVEPEVWSRRVTYQGLRETGVQIITDYHEAVSWSKRELIGAEHKFCVPFGDHFLSGVVDLLEYVPKKLKIVDYKTNSSQPNIDSLYLNIQFTAYHYASTQPEFWMGFDDGTGKYPGFPNGEELYERFKDTERAAIWFHLRKGKEINCGPRDDADYMRLYRCCQEIERAIEAGVFVPNISGTTCTFCSYTDICKAYIPPKEQR